MMELDMKDTAKIHGQSNNEVGSRLKPTSEKNSITISSELSYSSKEDEYFVFLIYREGNNKKIFWWNFLAMQSNAFHRHVPRDFYDQLLQPLDSSIVKYFYWILMCW